MKQTNKKRSRHKYAKSRKPRTKGTFFRVSPDYIELLKRLQREPQFKGYSQSDIQNVALSKFVYSSFRGIPDSHPEIYSLADKIDMIENKFTYY